MHNGLVLPSLVLTSNLRLPSPALFYTLAEENHMMLNLWCSIAHSEYVCCFLRALLNPSSPLPPLPTSFPQGCNQMCAAEAPGA